MSGESKQARLDRPPVETAEEAELRGLADVTMVQAADFGKLHDPLCRGEFDRPPVGRVLVEGEVRPHLMVVGFVVSGNPHTEIYFGENRKKVRFDDITGFHIVTASGRHWPAAWIAC